MRGNESAFHYQPSGGTLATLDDGEAIERRRPHGAGEPVAAAMPKLPWQKPISVKVPSEEISSKKASSRRGNSQYTKLAREL